ncbi:hypothetical protein D3C71_1583060 [compost metagenome]
MQRPPEALGALALRDDHLPRLRVAPRRGQLRDRDDALDRGARHWLREIGAATETRSKQRCERRGLRSVDAAADELGTPYGFPDEAGPAVRRL